LKGFDKAGNISSKWLSWGQTEIVLYEVKYMTVFSQKEKIYISGW